MKLIIDLPEEKYKEIKNILFYSVSRGNGKNLLFTLMQAIKKGTPLESYLPNERCDTCKYVDCSIDDEPCIDCKVPHKSFYEPKQGLESEADDHK